MEVADPLEPVRFFFHHNRLIPVLKQMPQASVSPEEIDPIGVILEDDRPLDSPHHDMVQGARGIQPWSAEHCTAKGSTVGAIGATLRRLSGGRRMR